MYSKEQFEAAIKAWVLSKNKGYEDYLVPEKIVEEILAYLGPQSS